MTTPGHSLLGHERQHLAAMLASVQRCTHLLHTTSTRIAWPLDAAELERRRRDTLPFEAIAAFRDSFTRQHRVLAAAMRQTALLLGHGGDGARSRFQLFVELGVLASADEWVQALACDAWSEQDHLMCSQRIAAQTNGLHQRQPMLLDTASALLHVCSHLLGVVPANADFADAFAAICSTVVRAERPGAWALVPPIGPMAGGEGRAGELAAQRG